MAKWDARRVADCNNRSMKARAGLLAVAILVTAPSALAKGPDTARICGASGCVTVDDVERVNVLALWGSALSARREPPPAPFYTVDLTSSFGTKQEWSFLYAPSARAVKVIRADFSGGVYGVQTTNDWLTPPPSVLAAYQRASATLKPFPADAEWVASTPDDRDVPWGLIATLVVGAAAGAALFFSRRLITRRGTRPAPG